MQWMFFCPHLLCKIYFSRRCRCFRLQHPTSYSLVTTPTKAQNIFSTCPQYCTVPAFTYSSQDRVRCRKMKLLMHLRRVGICSNLFFDKTCRVTIGRCITYHFHKVIPGLHVRCGHNIHYVQNIIINSNQICKGNG